MSARRGDELAPSHEDAPTDDGRDEPTLRDDVLRVLEAARFRPVHRWPDTLAPINPRLVRVGPVTPIGTVRVQWEGDSKAIWMNHKERIEAIAALRWGGLDAEQGGGVSVVVTGWMSDETWARVRAEMAAGESVAA